jgi:histidinol-phosphate aminotransferase
VPPAPDDGLELIKPSVRAEPAYTLEAPSAARKLNQNENPLDIPPELKRVVLERASALAWNRYPAFVPRHLVEVIAARHDWDPDGVLVGNGSNEVIQASLSVAVGPGDAVAAPQPTFALYRLITAVMGARYVPVPLGRDFLRYDVEALASAAGRESAKVIMLNSPNNPTGSAVPEGGVARLLAETRALILCDEAYQDFGGPTAVPLLATSSRLVVLRTFSKAFGMAGLRFGYALATPAVAREISKAKLPYNVNALTLAAAEVALEHQAELEQRTLKIIAERTRLIALLGAIPGIRTFPSSANFVLIRCEQLPATVIFRRLVQEHGILVRDVSGGTGLENCLRITVGREDDTDAVIAGLRAILGA